MTFWLIALVYVTLGLLEVDDVRRRIESLENREAAHVLLEGSAATAAKLRKYMLVRPLYFYFAGKPQGELLKFAEWVLSPEGQLVVDSVGYFPLSSAEREASHFRCRRSRSATC